MKKTFYILAAAIALVACTKETPVQEETSLPDQNTPEQPQTNNEETKPAITELFVSIAPIKADAVDASTQGVDTKAEIDNSTGAFTWSVNDEIAVKTAGGTVYKFTCQDAGETSTPTPAKFVCESETGSLDEATVVYPYKSDGTATDIPTSITGNTGALESENLRLSGTISGKAVTMSYTYAMLRLDFKNVPSFATQIVFDGADNDVTVTGLTITEKRVVTYIPVTPGSSKSFTVSIKDAQNNVILQKTTSGKTFTANTLKTMKSLTVGHIIRVIDDVDWGSRALYFRNVNNSGQYQLFTTGNAYPYKLNTVSDHDHYIVTPSTLSWMADGYPVVVSFRTEDDSKNTHTDCVWLFRDITFNVPSGLGMKTNYRIYPFRSGGEATTVNVKAIPAIVAKTPYGHNPAKIHIWGSGQESHNTTWSTQKEMTWFEEVSDSYKLWYYSFESNTPTVNFQFIITNNGSDTGKTGDLDAKFKDNKYTYVDNGSVEIESSLPSAADVTISTNKTASGYYELPSSVYGARVIIRIGDKGLWIPVINRDYDYGYNGS